MRGELCEPMLLLPVEDLPHHRHHLLVELRDLTLERRDLRFRYADPLSRNAALGLKMLDALVLLRKAGATLSHLRTQSLFVQFVCRHLLGRLHLKPR